MVLKNIDEYISIGVELYQPNRLNNRHKDKGDEETQMEGVYYSRPISQEFKKRQLLKWEREREREWREIRLNYFSW